MLSLENAVVVVVVVLVVVVVVVGWWVVALTGSRRPDALLDLAGNRPVVSLPHDG